MTKRRRLSLQCMVVHQGRQRKLRKVLMMVMTMSRPIFET